MAKALDLTGQRFGRLVVLRNATKDEKPKDANGRPKLRTWCICKCDCGNEIITMATSLNTGNTTSCGCYQKDKLSEMRSENLLGQRFEKLVVIKKDDPSLIEGRITWECQCDCGNITHVSTEKLKSGNTKSCGCLKGRKLIDLIGERFGKLTVLELDGQHEDGFYYWKCKCDCGKEIVVRGNNLKTGDTQSCGCTKSRGEQIVNDFLIQNNYIFKREYSFPDLLSDKNNPLKFDFCILNNLNEPIYIIEVNGSQHFNTENNWYSNQRQKYDIKKREYCKIHNIPILDLNYNKDDSIPRIEWLNQLASLGGNSN